MFGELHAMAAHIPVTEECRRVPCEDKDTVLADIYRNVDYLIPIVRSDRMAQRSICRGNDILRYRNIPDVTG